MYAVRDQGDGTAVLLWDKMPVAVVCRHECDGGRTRHVVQGVAVVPDPGAPPVRYEVLQSAGVVWFPQEPTVAEVVAGSEHTNRR